MADPKGMVLVVDTRENKPYRFAGSVRKALRSGDYSIQGMENRVSVERKCVPELLTATGRTRKRFERELMRLSTFDYAAIVIEGTLADVLKSSAFSKVRPKAVVHSLASWSVQWNIHVWFCNNRKLSRGMTHCLLEKFYKHRGGIRAGK